jgi:hypothetical protein
MAAAEEQGRKNNMVVENPWCEDTVFEDLAWFRAQVILLYLCSSYWYCRRKKIWFSNYPRMNWRWQRPSLCDCDNFPLVAKRFQLTSNLFFRYENKLMLKTRQA